MSFCRLRRCWFCCGTQTRCLLLEPFLEKKIYWIHSSEMGQDFFRRYTCVASWCLYVCCLCVPLMENVLVARNWVLCCNLNPEDLWKHWVPTPTFAALTLGSSQFGWSKFGNLWCEMFGAFLGWAWPSAEPLDLGLLERRRALWLENDVLGDWPEFDLGV